MLTALVEHMRALEAECYFASGPALARLWIGLRLARTSYQRLGQFARLGRRQFAVHHQGRLHQV